MQRQGVAGSAVPSEQPTIQSQLDSLEKCLIEAYALAGRVDQAADRIKPEPTSASTSGGAGDAPRPVPSVESRLRELHTQAQRLINALGHTADRLDKAV